MQYKAAAYSTTSVCGNTVRQMHYDFVNGMPQIIYVAILPECFSLLESFIYCQYIQSSGLEDKIFFGYICYLSSPRTGRYMGR